MGSTIINLLLKDNPIPLLLHILSFGLDQRLFVGFQVTRFEVPSSSFQLHEKFL